eukprot:11080238-Alexandrium_andersonii.AAC.1
MSLDAARYVQMFTDSPPLRLAVDGSPGLPPWTAPRKALRMLEVLSPPRRPRRPLHPLECIDRALCALPPPLEFSLGESAANLAPGKRVQRMRRAVAVLQRGQGSGGQELEQLLYTRGQYIDWGKNDATMRSKKGHVFTKGPAFLEEVLQHR